MNNNIRCSAWPVNLQLEVTKFSEALFSEAVVQRCSVKKVFLKILGLQLYLKRGSGTGVFLLIL